MITKREKKVRVSWPNYTRLPLIFFLYIVLCLISTPSSTWGIHIYTEFPPPPCSGAMFVGPVSINDKGDVLVVCVFFNPFMARKFFLYSGGAYTELLPSDCPSFWIVGSNGKGDVIGHCYGLYVPPFPPPPFTPKAILYSGGTYTELLPPGWAQAWVADINDKGDVVGYGHKDTTYKFFLYRNGTYTEFLLPPDCTWGSVSQINDKGDVLGYCGSPFINKFFVVTP